MKLFFSLGAGLAGLLLLVAFDPISILALAIGGLFAGAAIIQLVTLTLSIISNWLRQNRPLYRDAIAFAIKQDVARGNVRVVTGFFDTEKAEIKTYQIYESEKLDEELRRILPEKDEMVVFT